MKDMIAADGGMQARRMELVRQASGRGLSRSATGVSVRFAD